MFGIARKDVRVFPKIIDTILGYILKDRVHMSHLQYWLLCILVLVCVTEWLVRAPQFETIKIWILKVTPKFAEETVGGFLYCTLCLGFWIGLIGTIIGKVDSIFVNRPITWIASAFLVSVLSIYLDRLLFGIDKHNNLDSE